MDAFDLKAVPTRLSKVMRLILSQAGAAMVSIFNSRRIGSDLGRGEARHGRSL